VDVRIGKDMAAHWALGRETECSAGMETTTEKDGHMESKSVVVVPSLTLVGRKDGHKANKWGKAGLVTVPHLL
jgi:hypothetical protein